MKSNYSYPKINEIIEPAELEIVTQLDLDRLAVDVTTQEIDMMYKLPKHSPEDAVLADKKQVINVPASLNTNGNIILNCLLLSSSRCCWH